MNNAQSTVSGGGHRIWPSLCPQCGAPLSGKPAGGVLTCEHCGTAHRGTPVQTAAQSSDREFYERLTPQDLPPGCGIEVLEASPESLRLQIGQGELSFMSIFGSLFALAFAIGWYSIVFFIFGSMWNHEFGPGKVFIGLFMVPFLLAGLAPLTMGLYGLAGRFTIELTPRCLSCRCKVGPLGYTRSLPVESIDSVGLEMSPHAPRDRGPGEMTATAASSRVCVARGGRKRIQLSLHQDELLARRIASLVRTRLEELGHPVP